MPGPYSSDALDKAYFPMDRPGEQPQLQNNAASFCGPPGPEAAASTEEHVHCPTQGTGEHLQQTNLPGNQPHLAYLSGDPDQPRVASMASPECKCEEQRSFPEEQRGKASQPTVTFLDLDPSQLHFYNVDQPPALLGSGGEMARQPAEQAGKPLAPSNFPRDKIHLPSASSEDHIGTATAVAAGYLAAAEMGAREASWEATEPPLVPSSAAATLPRSHRTNRPLPQPPSQRSADVHPHVGQVPAASSVGLAAPHKQVPGAALVPERPPEPRVTGDPALVLLGDVGPVPQCPMPAPAPQPGLLEKVREGTRVPPLQPRAEPIPLYSSCGFSAPVPPTRTMESKLAAALHAGTADMPNMSTYHSFAAVDDSLPLPLPISQPKHAPQKAAYTAFATPDLTAEPFGPENCVHFTMTPNCQFRPQSVPPHPNKLEQHQVYGARSEPPVSMGPPYGTYVAPGRSTTGLHAKPCSRVEYVPSLSSTIRNPCYPEDIPPYPTIRRVQSLHAPPASTIRSVPISRTEVPPDDEPAYCPRPLYQYKPYPPSQARSDYHVTQLQPYFENGRVHYRYSPYSSASTSYFSPDGTLCDVDTYSTMQLRPLHRLPNRDFAFYNPRLPGKSSYSYGGLPPRPRATAAGFFPGHDHSLGTVLPPSAEAKASYASWNLEDMEKYRLQSLRRDSRARQKAKGPVMSQYDNMTPAGQDDLGGIYVIHLRSKSDPGKTGLLSVAETKEGRLPTKVSPEGDERFCRRHLESELDPRVHPHSSFGNGQAEKPSLPQKQSSLRSRKHHEPGCGLPEHRAHQESSHRPLCESKNGTPFPPGPLEYGASADPISYHNSGGKYVPTGQEALTLRLNPREVRLFQELERPRARAEKHSRDGFKEEDSGAAPPKPERSHSLKLHHSQAGERDPNAPYHYPMHGKRHSGGMAVVSQYDNLEGYHSLPQHQRAGFGGGAGGPCVPAGFPHPQSRTYATALGQGAFLQAELALQRPETQVHAE